MHGFSRTVAVMLCLALMIIPIVHFATATGNTVSAEKMTGDDGNISDKVQAERVIADAIEQIDKFDSAYIQIVSGSYIGRNDLGEINSDSGYAVVKRERAVELLNTATE